MEIGWMIKSGFVTALLMQLILLPLSLVMLLKTGNVESFLLMEGLGSLTMFIYGFLIGSAD